MKNQFWKSAEKLFNKGVKKFCKKHSISERKINKFLRDPSVSKLTFLLHNLSYQDLFWFLVYHELSELVPKHMRKATIEQRQLDGNVYPYNEDMTPGPMDMETGHINPDPSDNHDVCWLKFALHIHQLIAVVAEEKMNRIVRLQAQIRIEQIQSYLTKIS